MSAEIPKKVHKIEELQIPEGIVESLILKFVKREFSLDSKELAKLLKISVNIVSSLLQELIKKKLLDSPAPPKVVLTAAGKEMTRILERDDAYCGPVPVSFEKYSDLVIQQSEMERRVTLSEVQEAFAGYEIEESVLKIIKEGFNSQKPMLLFGPPGNGKSLITHRIHALLQDPVLIPYAIAFSGKCVRTFDPAYHSPVPSPKEALSGLDERWALCRAPLVIVGTEFRVEHFDITFAGSYDAPPQVKANNGIFVLDDLGRQAQDHNMILNQFIYPLENRKSIVRMPSGASMHVPYRQRLFLSTNLDKNSLIDDAFQRRLLYQVPILPPSENAFIQIFCNEGKKRSLDETCLREKAKTLLSWYREDNYQIRACDPRNFLIMLDAMVDPEHDLPSLFQEDNLREIYMRYPKAEAKEGLSLKK